MNATDVFLFTLAFLVSGLLAGWILRLSRQGEVLADRPGRRSRDGELEGIGARLASAVTRIEALERQHEQLAQQLGTRTGSGARQGGGDRGERPQPGPEGAGQGPQPLDAEPGSEISESQWRTAMGRLGPAWGSRSRPGEPGRLASPVERRGGLDGPDRRPGPRALRPGTPVDILFSPRE